MGLTILIQQENKNEARTKTAERQSGDIRFDSNPAMGFDHQRGDIRFDSNTFIQA